MPEVTVLIASYNPRIEKLKTCLKSIILQRDISTQIVITDDGSRDNQFDKVEAFLKKHGYTNYKLVANAENRGTVKNMISGLPYCTGDFIKPISPDDYLYGEYALRRMVSYAYKQQADAVMCGAVYYCDDDGFKLLSSKALPQYPEVYNKSSLIKKYYCLFEDRGLGVSFLIRAEKYYEYMRMIEDKVIYAEDTAYKIMVACDCRIDYLSENCILYEYGHGVSTSGDSEWERRIAADYRAADEIIYERATDKTFIEKYRAIKESDEKKTIILKLKKYIKVPEFVPFVVRLKLQKNPRMTSTEYKGEYLEKLFDSRLNQEE